jgi:hypothetical protein
MADAMLLLIPLSAMFGGLAGAIAAAGGRSIWGPFFLGAILGPLGIVIALALPRPNESEIERVTGRVGLSVRTVAYWALVAVLATVGLLGVLTIGAPFLLLGVVLAVVGPHRHRRAVFWPVVVGVVAFVGGFVLIAPVGCTATSHASSAGASTGGQTTCTNVVGIDYSGVGLYRPSLIPALLAGLASCAVAAALTGLLVRRRGRPHDLRPS